MAVVAKLLATILRATQVLGTLFNTGCCTYFVVNLSNRNLLNSRALAVEIISAAGLLWSVLVLVLSVCLLQKSFFQLFTIFWDFLFIGGNVAIAILLRGSFSGDCAANGILVPWLERGGNNLTANCRLIQGIFIVSIVLAVLFFLTCLTAFMAHRSSKKDKGFGPSPDNDYTSGRGRKHKKDVEAASGPALAPPVTDNRVSRESEYTDVTEKTNDGMHGTAVGGPGREYLAPRGTYPAATESTVSPIPSSVNLRNKDHSHAGQYAMAGALAGGAAAHHHHKNNAYGHTDNLPNHPGPEDHTTDYIPNHDQDRLGTMNTYDQDRLGTMNTYGTQTNSFYSELDNTTTTGPPSTYATPGAYPGSRGAVQPTAFYPAATELPSSNNNPNFYSHEMDASAQPHEMSSGREYGDYLSPNTPEVDHNREEVGFGYGSGPGMVGGGANEVSTLPEMGREDHRRF